MIEHLQACELAVTVPITTCLLRFFNFTVVQPHEATLGGLHWQDQQVFVRLCRRPKRKPLVLQNIFLFK